ncbi:G-protein beta WD-40 repeats containing protein, partial [Reticulomyxa filosa]
SVIYGDHTAPTDLTKCGSIDLKKVPAFFILHHPRSSKKQKNELKLINESVLKDSQIIIQHWIRILNIKLGWIKDFDKLVVNYVSTVVTFEKFRSSSNLLNTFTGHTNWAWSIDYSIFDCSQLICSGSHDKTVRVWDVDNSKQIQSFNGHSSYVYSVKFSPYHYHNHRQNVTCSSSFDKTIRFWDFKHDRQLKIFNEHTWCVSGIEFSQFSGGRYLCSASWDRTIRLWDVETSKSLHVFNGHRDYVWCVDISPLQSNNKNNTCNSIGVIGGNGYTICSGSWDKTIRIWDIDTTKQFNVFKGHTSYVRGVKYGSNELVNTILSGSEDKSVRLWDIRSSKQIQVFNGHTNTVWSVEYPPFIIENNSSYSNVICSGSYDNTIRFWDIRSNKNELHVIKGDEKDDCGILCFKFIELKRKDNDTKNTKNGACDLNLCYGSVKGSIHIWG